MILVLLLLVIGSGVEPATARQHNETPTVLTLYSEAGFWGNQLRTQILASDGNETVEVITSTELAAANLLSRISSVRLRCGSRDSHVMLHTGRHTSSDLRRWSALGVGYPIHCSANTTRLVNLHTDAVQLADRVGSVYFVAHARDIQLAYPSDLIERVWPRALQQRMPAGARADGAVQLRLMSPSWFTVTQKLKLDDWRCGGRAAYLQLSAHLRVSRAPSDDSADYFNVHANSYVDDAWGDLWGCRERMEDRLRSAANAGAADLEARLNQLANAFVRGHSRYYMVPLYRLSDFWLVGGGDPPQVADPGRQ
jgi:hypothetical protein